MALLLYCTPYYRVLVQSILFVALFPNFRRIVMRASIRLLVQGPYFLNGVHHRVGHSVLVRCCDASTYTSMMGLCKDMKPNIRPICKSAYSVRK